MDRFTNIEIDAATSDADMQAKLSYLNPVYSNDLFNVFTDSLTGVQTQLLNSLSQRNLASLTMRNQRFPYTKACSFCKHLILHGDVDMELLQQAVEDVALVTLQIQQPEKARQYQPVKSSHVKVVREALYPAYLVDFALQLRPDELESLKLNYLRGTTRYYSYLLRCRQLSHLELPFFTDDTKDVTAFVAQIFTNNPKLQQMSSYFGELLSLSYEGLSLSTGDGDQSSYNHNRFNSHIRTFSQQVLDSEYDEVKMLESTSNDEFNYDMLRAREKLSLVRQAQGKADEVLYIYQQLAIRGILADEPYLGITVVCITADKKHILFYSAKERGPQYVIDNKERLKPLKVKVSYITEYYSGSPDEPMNHQFLTLNCGKTLYRFKVRDYADDCIVETQDQSIAFVEVLRQMYGLEVLYGNIICKYLNKKYPGRFELLL